MDNNENEENQITNTAEIKSIIYSPSKKRWYERKPLLNFLDFVQKAVVIIGIPISIITYANAKYKERKQQEYVTYDKMDEKYWQYEALALRYPLLGVAYATNIPPFSEYTKPDSLLSKEELVIRREIMYQLISVYERAYIMYAEQSTDFQKRQWRGWNNTLKSWLKNRVFKDAWEDAEGDYDQNFQKYVNEVLRDVPQGIRNSK